MAEMDVLFRLADEHACAYLTAVCSAVGGNNGITAYFLFKGKQLAAADLGAYRDDTRKALRDGFVLVEKKPVLLTADAIQRLAPQLSRKTGPFGEFRAVNLGFAHSVVVIYSGSPGHHLVGLTHPKDDYIYGTARKTRDRLIELVEKGELPTFTAGSIAHFRGVNPFAGNYTAADPAAVRNLPELPISDLAELMSQDYFCEPAVSGLSGFLFIEDDGSGRKIRAASSSLTNDAPSRAGKIWLKDEYAPLAGRIFLEETLSTLLQAHDDFGRDTQMLPLTGSLRSFWFSFERAVIGVYPFKSGKAGGRSIQYFLVSACHSTSDEEPPFNYEFARRSIQRLCDEAE